jgi:hypothetical protein
MSNALVCLNLRDFMPSHVRESFSLAARKWGAEYVEITEPLGDMHHFWQKALIPLSRYAVGFDRILQLDCDMLIRSDCPSLFALVPNSRFGAVSQVQHQQEWAALMGLVPYPRQRLQANLGLIVYSPTVHRPLLEEWQETGLRCNYYWVKGMPPEQFALSCLLYSMRIPMRWLPWKFNAIRAQRQPSGIIRTPIAHFCGSRGRLREIVDQYEWIVP